ncbi:MAG: cytidine deaminase [Bacteroidetes bacterium]|nr:MAG: cytidine deaminase [Bacteroidota bacterium]
MKKKEIKIEYFEYDNISELDLRDVTLINSAKEAIRSSYSPYSNFSVGAAVRLANGEIIIGSNQENGAYPSGLCAERVALFAAGSQFPGVAIEAIAIAANAKNGLRKEPVVPCGACRQVMLEYEKIGKRNMKVIMYGENDSCYITKDVKSILPFAFDGGFLK